MHVPRKAYIIQESGSVTLPAEFRRKYNLKAGDEITFVETEEGLLISPKQILIQRVLDEIGQELEAQGLSVDELMALGREERGALLKELYDIDEAE